MKKRYMSAQQFEDYQSVDGVAGHFRSLENEEVTRFKWECSRVDHAGGQVYWTYLRTGALQGYCCRCKQQICFPAPDRTEPAKAAAFFDKLSSGPPEKLLKWIKNPGAAFRPIKTRGLRRPKRKEK